MTTVQTSLKSVKKYLVESYKMEKKLQEKITHLQTKLSGVRNDPTRLEYEGTMTEEIESSPNQQIKFLGWIMRVVTQKVGGNFSLPLFRAKVIEMFGAREEVLKKLEKECVTEVEFRKKIQVTGTDANETK